MENNHNINYQYFLDKHRFTEKYNIDWNMSRLLTEYVCDDQNGVQTPVINARHLSLKKINFSKSFIAVILCGGKAVRFNGRYKAVFEIPNAIKNNENLTFLELNIQQILSYENKHKINVPVIIYDDFATRDPIKKLLKSKQYFGKNKSDFIHVMQTSWFRYIPNKSMLERFNLLDHINNEQINSLPIDSDVYKSRKLIDSVVGTGHFVFNSIIASSKFKKLIRSRPDISKIVVSNCDNLGKKYYSNLVENDGLNYAIVTDRKSNERMDGVYMIDNQIKIIPYFKEREKSAKLGFTGTAYISINTMVNVYKFQNKKKYFETNNLYPNIGNTYNPIVKLIKSSDGEKVTVHFESVLSDISNFLEIRPVYVNRELSFFPFKTIDDVNEGDGYPLK